MKTLKYEEVHRNEYRDLAEARTSIREFLEKIYNQKRLHSALRYLPQPYLVLPPERWFIPLWSLRYGCHSDGRFNYVCGGQPYRSGMGCGPRVYLPQAQVESEVLSGLRGVLDLCAAPQKFRSSPAQSTRNYDNLGGIHRLQTGRGQADRRHRPEGGGHPPPRRGGTKRRELDE
jgi:Integrase core domain